MLDKLFGSKSAESVLLYLQNYGDGHVRGIAETMKMSPSQAQKQLSKFESGGFLVSRRLGRTRVYSWKPGNPLVSDLRQLLETRLELSTPVEREQYFRERRRPRKNDKPL
jgi:DNA-binding transcriptional ArsR family regulator